MYGEKCQNSTKRSESHYLFFINFMTNNYAKNRKMIRVNSDELLAIDRRYFCMKRPLNLLKESVQKVFWGQFFLIVTLVSIGVSASTTVYFYAFITFVVNKYAVRFSRFPQLGICRKWTSFFFWFVWAFPCVHQFGEIQIS